MQAWAKVGGMALLIPLGLAPVKRGQSSSVLSLQDYCEYTVLAGTRKKSWPPSLTAAFTDLCPEALFYAYRPLILFVRPALFCYYSGYL